MATSPDSTFFAPELHIPNGTFNIDFYKKFGATEHFCFRNDDGSIHVAELELNGAIFHMHETMRDALEPIRAKGMTSVIGLFVPNVDEVMQKAIFSQQCLPPRGRCVWSSWSPGRDTTWNESDFSLPWPRN